MPTFIMGLLAIGAVIVVVMLLLQRVRSTLDKKGILEYPVYIALFGLHLLLYLAGVVVLCAFPDHAKAIKPENPYSYGIILFALLPAGFVKRNAVITRTQMVFTSERMSNRSERGQYIQLHRLTAGQDKELQQANKELLQWEKRLEKLHNEKTIEEVRQKIEALKQRIELIKGNITPAAKEPMAISSVIMKINRLQTNAALQLATGAILYVLQYGVNLLIYQSSQSLIFPLAIYAFACVDAILFSVAIRDLLFRWRMPKEPPARTLFVFASYIISAVLFLGVTRLLTGGMI